MGRIRTIRPEFPKYQYLADCSRDARLLYLLMKTEADDHGRLRADSRMLANSLYPYDEGEKAARPLISAWLADLVRNGCVVVYDVGKERFAWITHWHDEERVDKANASKLPAPESGEAVTATALMDDSGLHNPLLASPRESSRAFANGREFSRDVANPREPSRILASENPVIPSESETCGNPREPSRAFASVRESSRLLSGREEISGRDIRKGGGVGEPSEFDLTGDAGSASSKAGKSKTKLPKPYPFTPEHLKVGASILPADADVEAEFRDAFCAFWHSKGEMKADWMATWRVWCNNGVTRGTYRRKRPEPPAHGTATPRRNPGGIDWLHDPEDPPSEGGS